MNQHSKKEKTLNQTCSNQKSKRPESWHLVFEAWFGLKVILVLLLESCLWSFSVVVDRWCCLVSCLNDLSIMKQVQHGKEAAREGIQSVNPSPISEKVLFQPGKELSARDHHPQNKITNQQREQQGSLSDLQQGSVRSCFQLEVQQSTKPPTNQQTTLNLL